MKTNRVTTVYFSATGTTRKIISAVTEGLHNDEVRKFDLTKPEARKDFQSPDFKGEELLIIGVPVHAGRVPNFLIPVLEKLSGDEHPAVLISVYGNIDEGKAIEHLKNILEESGFKIIGAGSFIGEHSYSCEENKIGHGRPNEKDLEKARRFGGEISKKIGKINDISNINNLKLGSDESIFSKIMSIVSIPQYSSKIFIKTPKVDRDKCNFCEVCYNECPTGAIDKESLNIDEGKCIRCMSCVKSCPNNARKIEYRFPSLVKTFFKLNGSGKYKEPTIQT